MRLLIVGAYSRPDIRRRANRHGSRGQGRACGRHRTGARAFAQGRRRSHHGGCARSTSAGSSRALEGERIPIPVVACGIKSDADAAVAAIKAGAKEYIPLPPDAELIAAVIEAVARESLGLPRPRSGNGERRSRSPTRSPPPTPRCSSPASRGTGKEVVAKYLHRKSKRAGQARSSRSIARRSPRTFSKSSFSATRRAPSPAPSRGASASSRKPTAARSCSTKSREMDVRLQAKLLRAIQERMIDRVGGGKPVPVDIRIIATSNRNLAEAVQQGHVPRGPPVPPQRRQSERAAAARAPGRYRRARRALRRRNTRRPTASRSAPLSPRRATRLLSAHWPGNVRELENTLHRAVLLSAGRAHRGPKRSACPTVSALAPFAPHRAARSGRIATRANLVGRTVDDVERDLILETLDHCLGNRTHAANILGISIRTLRNKLKQYTDEGMPVPPPGEARLSA